MKGRGTRLLCGAVLLCAALLVTACGAFGGEEPSRGANSEKDRAASSNPSEEPPEGAAQEFATDSERAAPSEPRQTQAESTPESVPRESAREGPTQDESVKEGAPAEDKAAQSKQESAQGGEESSSLSVTTIEGEEVRLGGQGDVMALYFMAGW